MSDIDLAVTRCKEFEALLEQEFGALGRGLHEKLTSVEGKLPAALVKRLRFIATIRNKIVHDADYQAIDDREGFIQACSQAEGELRALCKKPTKRRPWGTVVGVLFWLVVVAVGLVYLYRKLFGP